MNYSHNVEDHSKVLNAIEIIIPLRDFERLQVEFFG